MQDNDSDLQHEDEGYEIDSPDNVDEHEQEEEIEESEGDVEQGESEEKPTKTSYVDTSKIQDPELRKQIDGRIGELYRLSKVGEKAESEARKLREELEAIRNKQELVEVAAPSVDLAIDDPQKFAEQQRLHSEYLAKKYQHDQQEQAKAKQVEEANRQAQAEKITAYNKRVKALKIEPEILKAASEQVVSAGISNDLVEFLLEHDYGPALVKHLGTNFEDLYEVSNMSPLKAVAYIEKSVLPKAVQKKTPSAPPPPTKVKGARNSQNTVTGGWEIS